VIIIEKGLALLRELLTEPSYAFRSVLLSRSNISTELVLSLETKYLPSGLTVIERISPIAKVLKSIFEILVYFDAPLQNDALLFHP